MDRSGGNGSGSGTEEEELSELMRTLGLLFRRMRSAAAGHGLSMGEMMALARLEREGATTTAELARAEGVTPQSMGATVAALEGAGLVVRRPDASDGRRIRISITGKGSALRQRVVAAKKQWLQSVLAGLSDEERRMLFSVGEALRRAVAQ